MPADIDDNLIILEQLKSSVKDTIGYSEAVNKDSFMTGAQVAFSKSEKHYVSEINQLKIQLAHSEKRRGQVEKDIKTLVEIISKYQYE